MKMLGNLSKQYFKNIFNDHAVEWDLRVHQEVWEIIGMTRIIGTPCQPRGQEDQGKRSGLRWSLTRSVRC